MAPDWEKLATEWESHAVGLIAEVDCTTDDGQPLCEEHNVEGFPTLMSGDPHALDVSLISLVHRVGSNLELKRRIPSHF